MINLNCQNTYFQSAKPVIIELGKKVSQLVAKILLLVKIVFTHLTHFFLGGKKPQNLNSNVKPQSPSNGTASIVSTTTINTITGTANSSNPTPTIITTTTSNVTGTSTSNLNSS